MVGIPQRGDWEAVTAQCSRGRAVFTFGCIDDVLGQEAMVGFRVWVINNGGHAATVFGWGNRRGGRRCVQRFSGGEG